MQKQEEDIKSTVMASRNIDARIENLRLHAPGSKISNALSFEAGNILRWYTFKENASVLELGAHYGERSEVLLEKDLSLTSLISSDEESHVLNARFQKSSNKHTVFSQLKKALAKEYDYIVMYEWLPFSQMEKELIKDHISAGTTLIIITFNSLSFNNFSNGALGQSTNPPGYSEKMIHELLDELGCNTRKWWYPFPDHTQPSEIVSKLAIKKYTPSVELYGNSSDTRVSKQLLIHNICSAGSLETFAPSFFIEAKK